MPFITEELWQHLCDRTDGESLMVSPLSMSALVDEDIIREFEVVKEVISNIRSCLLYTSFPTSQIVNVRDKLFMIDCGEGAQLQFRKSHLKFSRLNQWRTDTVSNVYYGYRPGDFLIRSIR